MSATKVRGRGFLPETIALLLRLLLAGVVAHLVGAFPTGVLLGRTWGGVDPRFADSSRTGGLGAAGGWCDGCCWSLRQKPLS